VLKGAEGVSDVVLVGDGLRLFVDDASRRVPEVRAIIASANLPFDRIEEAAPTIEDLFVQAVAKESGRSAGG
jgi:ABC-type transporter Mla subunit MlaD